RHGATSTRGSGACCAARSARSTARRVWRNLARRRGGQRGPAAQTRFRQALQVAEYAPEVLDDRVRAVLAHLEEEDRREREEGVAREQRARQVARTTGQFLFALVAPQTDCEVLEIGGSRGYSTIWLAAGVRYLGGRVLSLESDPVKIEAWRRNVADAGLEGWVDLVEGDAYETLPAIADVFAVVLLEA